jgi:hypothetical protein
MVFFIRLTTEAFGIRPPCLYSLPPSLLSPRMEVPLAMLEFSDKALLLKACTNPRMLALHGRRDLPSMWISNVWRQMEAMCSQVAYLRLITQRILGKAGTSVLHPGTALLVAASSLIHLEAARYSLAMKWGCSYRRIAVRRGSQSMKDFRGAQSLMLKRRAWIIFICLPVLGGRASGENFLARPQHPRRLRAQLQLQP